MKIAQLFSAYDSFKMGQDPMREVSLLTFDSREVKPGAVYFAVRGSKNDGHKFLKEVCKSDVAGLVVEDAREVPTDFSGALLVVKSTREALVRLASRYYNYPAEKLMCIGVTGTNGKTSTTYMIESILNKMGMGTGVMGTINHHFKDKVWKSELTTPDAITLQKRLREFVALGARAVAFEVSSHAIAQNRVDGIPFQCAVFTNLTRDHLDYHNTMQNYFETKEKLFNDLLNSRSDTFVYAILNANDEWAKKIRVAPNAKTWTYGEVKSDFQFQVTESDFSGVSFKLQSLRGDANVRLQVPGRHNVYNAVAAIATGLAAGASLETCVAGIEEFRGVPGRLERVFCKERVSQPTVFVDYAHTDDALRTVLGILSEIRERSRSKGKIITVFGCGGDRDKGKRPLMAKAAKEGSDIVFVTSDNPRSEDPKQIIEEILVEMPNELLNREVFVEVDRRVAIKKAIELAGPKDVVLIAGKGHEDYQILGDKKIHFSDVEVAGEYLNEL